MKTKRAIIVGMLVFILLAALAVQTTLAKELVTEERPYFLKLNKESIGLYDTTWIWEITKAADLPTQDQPNLILSPGQVFPVNYTVTVDATSTDVWTVAGKIVISNYSGESIQIIELTDVLGNGTSVEVICTGEDTAWTNPLPDTWTNNCKYTASGTGPRPTTNTVTMKYENSAGSQTLIFTEENINYTLGNETDECINVTDDKFGSLGTVCAGAAPKTFSYSLPVGPYDVCGEYQFINTASFVTNDTGASGKDSWTVDISIPCEGGCTLTPGYWKTHSSYGPAPYDNTWAEIGEDTTFFLSGQSYYQVLWTSPSGGNAYYILAHAYIAAKLNLLNGASSTSQVDDALTWAENFFNTYTPTSKLSKTERGKALTNATLLDMHNNGYFGPGHCSE